MDMPQLYHHLGFYASCFARANITPDLEVDSIADIDPTYLKRKRIAGLIFDVDNTLTYHNGIVVDLGIADKFRVLTRLFPSCIVSNTNSGRQDKLEKYFGLPAVKSTKKPMPDAFYEAMGILGTDPEQTGMIGDRLITDIAGGNKAGLYTIKVKPVRLWSEPKSHIIIRKFEDLLLEFYTH